MNEEEKTNHFHGPITITLVSGGDPNRVAKKTVELLERFARKAPPKSRLRRVWERVVAFFAGR